MLDLKRNRHWFWLTGILAILIGVTVWLFVLFSHRIRSGDVLLYDEEKIWLLNPSDYSLSLLVDMASEGFVIGGDVHASPKHDSLYLTAQRDTGDPKEEPILLLRYDLRSEELQVIADTPGLARMSPVFPDGKHAIVMINSPDWPDPGAITTICVLEFATEDCLPISRDVPYIDINKELWLSEDTLITSDYRTPNDLYILSFSQGKFSIRQTIPRHDSPFSIPRMALLPDRHVLFATYRNDYKPVLISLDVNSLEWSDLPVVPTDFRASFKNVSVSPDTCYVAYEEGRSLEVKELCSNKTIATLDRVMYSAWIRGTDSMLICMEQDDPHIGHDELIVLDVSTGRTQALPAFDHRLWFETVP